MYVATRAGYQRVAGSPAPRCGPPDAGRQIRAVRSAAGRRRRATGRARARRRGRRPPARRRATRLSRACTSARPSVGPSTCSPSTAPSMVAARSASHAAAHRGFVARELGERAERREAERPPASRLGVGEVGELAGHRRAHHLVLGHARLHEHAAATRGRRRGAARRAARSHRRLRGRPVRGREQLLVEIEERDQPDRWVAAAGRGAARPRCRSAMSASGTASVAASTSATSTRGTSPATSSRSSRRRDGPCETPSRDTPGRRSAARRRIADRPARDPVARPRRPTPRSARARHTCGTPSSRDAAPPVQDAHDALAAVDRAVQRGGERLGQQPDPGRLLAPVDDVEHRGHPRASTSGRARSARAARRAASASTVGTGLTAANRAPARRRALGARRRARARSASAPPAAPRRRRRRTIAAARSGTGASTAVRPPTTTQRTAAARRPTPRCAPRPAFVGVQLDDLAPVPGDRRAQPAGARPARPPRRSSSPRRAHERRTSSRRIRQPAATRTTRTARAERAQRRSPAVSGRRRPRPRAPGPGATTFGGDAARSTRLTRPRPAPRDPLGERRRRRRGGPADTTASNVEQPVGVRLGLDVVGDDPAAHPPAVQRDPHDRADPDERRERVRERGSRRRARPR